MKQYANLIFGNLIIYNMANTIVIITNIIPEAVMIFFISINLHLFLLGV